MSLQWNANVLGLKLWKWWVTANENTKFCASRLKFTNLWCHANQKMHSRYRPEFSWAINCSLILGLQASLSWRRMLTRQVSRRWLSTPWTRRVRHKRPTIKVLTVLWSVVSKHIKGNRHCKINENGFHIRNGIEGPRLRGKWGETGPVLILWPVGIWCPWQSPNISWLSPHMNPDVYMNVYHIWMDMNDHTWKNS